MAKAARALVDKAAAGAPDASPFAVLRTTYDRVNPTSFVLILFKIYTPCSQSTRLVYNLQGVFTIYKSGLKSTSHVYNLNVAKSTSRV
jgi:hypothetical protein